MTSFSHKPGTVNYPRMERQDLTQGQLGSFKFTPTDEIPARSVQYPGYLVPPQQSDCIMQSQYSSTSPNRPRFNPSGYGGFNMPNRITESGKPSDFMPTYENLYAKYGEENPVVFDEQFEDILCRNGRGEHGNSDPAFFERYLKHDLANARLRLGPAVVRAAIDGTSPTSKKSLRNFDPHHPMLSDTTNISASKYAPHHLRESSELTSKLSSFPVSACEGGMDEEGTSQASLIRALASEQETHQTTKVTLKHTLDALQKSQQEVFRLLTQNRSLTGSNEMLKGIVQHNVKKQGHKATGIPDHATVEAAVARFHAEVKEARQNPTQSILYKNNGYLQHEQEVTNGQTTTPHASPATTYTNRAMREEDFNEIYNFDLLPSADRVDNFEGNHANNVNTSPSVSEHSHLLVNVQLEPNQESPRIVHSGHANIDNSASLTNSVLSSGKMASTGRTTVYLADSAKPTLELPAAFVNQYQKPKTAGEARSTDNGNEPFVVCEHQSSRNYKAPPVSTNEPIYSQASLSQDTLRAKSPNNATQSSDKAKPITMAMPYDPSIGWKITPFSPVFEDNEDKIAHLGRPKRHGDQLTPFYDHPVRYMPNKGEKNLFRTVMIDFIPCGSGYLEVLDQIRGGPLESIQLFGPIGPSNDFMTARVVFNYELDAQALYQYGQKPGLVIDGKRLRVWQVLEPTYPKNEQLERDFFEDRFTRLLVMDGISDAVDAKLPDKLADQVNSGFVIQMGLSLDGLRMVEFTSVAECAKAMRQLVADPELAGANFDFERDPCEARC